MAFDTTQPAQLTSLGAFDYNPILTIGDTITNENGSTYTPPGIPDGTGAFELDEDTVRILVNHELVEDDGYAYTLANGTSLQGGRVSYFDVNKNTLEVEGAGLAYDTIINRAGEVVDEASDLDFGGISRLCSANYIPAEQFGAGIGLVDAFFFTGEETSAGFGGTEFALDPVTNTLYALPWLGRAAWESVTELNTGTTDKVAILIGDDRAPAPLLLYVGTKNPGSADILERNGLAGGKLYVWVANNGDTTPEAFNGTGSDRNGRFVEIDYYRPDLASTDGSTGYDAQGFATLDQQDALATDAGAFFFSRPEDVATNPADGTVAVMASTGRGELYPSDNWGTTYKIDVDFNSLLSESASVPTDENNAPFLLPAGFTQTKIVDRNTANLDPDFAATFGIWDMIALDPSNRYIYIPSEVGSGAGLARYDTQTGDFISALTGNPALPLSSDPTTWDPNNDNFARFDPATYTPFDTVITGEEGGNGRLFEWLNPLADAGVTPEVAWRSNIPSVAHEGLRFDVDGNLYFIDEFNSGSLYKFVPKVPGDLSIGQSFVLSVDAFAASGGVASENWNSVSNSTATRTGAFTWVAITDADGNALTTTNPFDFTTLGGRATADELGGTPYGRPEDLEIIGNTVYVAVTSENAVYGINLETNEIQIFANRDTIDGATGLPVGSDLRSPDNLASDAAGNLYIIEDNNPGDIWKATDLNDDSVAESITRWASLGVEGSEPTGLISTNNPNEFIVAVQHPSSDNDALWRITAGEITANLKILYDGDDAGAGQFAGPDFGLRSPDNLDWADNGKIYIQEDRSTASSIGAFGATSGEEASIWELDPFTGELTRIAQTDRTGVPTNGQVDTRPTDLGNWETSGILDVSTLFDREPGTLLFVDVQAHSLDFGPIGDPTVPSSDPTADDQNLVEGGQLGFLIASEGFTTSQPKQVISVDDTAYLTDAIFTIGETVDGYTPPGILDGMGAFELDSNTVRVLVNHELRETAGYAYTLANGTTIQGARVSYFDINKTTFEVEGSGLAFDTIINRRGEVVDEASDLEFGGISRLCSANYIPAEQFGSGIGLVDGFFFTGEETSSGFGGTEFALDPVTNTLYALPWLGRAAWESVTELNTGTTDKIALLIGDDRAPAPAILYIGTKNPGSTDILERNGLTGGKLYVWAADGGVTTPEAFNGTFNETSGLWKEIDFYRPDLASADGSTGYDAQGFATLAQQDVLAATEGAFFFSRPEDVATNPNDGTEVVLASTGRGELYPSDNWGTTYSIKTTFDADGNPVSATTKILYDGDDAGAGQFAGPDFGLRSPDNLDWADNGKIYIQEDRSTASSIGAFGATSGEEASIWELDPATGELTRIAQVDRSAVPTNGQVDVAPTDLGNWETSGILDVSALFGQAPGTLLIANTQAHSLRSGPISSENLVEGGQLFFITQAVEGSNSSDVINGINVAQTLAGLNGSDIIRGGDSDDVLRGDRNSRSEQANKSGGADIIFGGGGNDRIGGKAGNDQLFGEAGDDQIWGDGGDDLLSGGLGNDTLYGDSKLTVGADIFVLAIGEGVDTIKDYNKSGIVDTIVVLGSTTAIAEQDGSNTLIKVGSEVLAIVENTLAGNVVFG